MPVLPAFRRRSAVLGLALAVLVTGAATGSAQAAPASRARSCAATPFRSRAGAHVWYRIPAIVRTDAGTLLAFAERRDSMEPSSDTGDTDVVVARSVDRGCTWTAPRVVAAHGSDTVGNPAPVVDRDTGRVLLLTVDRPQGGTSLHGLHVQRSTDDGRSFTPYGSSGGDLFGLPGWSGGLTGPGHALQLSSGPHAGRIVVPIGYQRDGRRGAYGIVSDDHGATWSIGYDSRGDDHRQEGTVAQLADGRLWISYHEQSSGVPVGTGRIAALSSDGGATLSTPFTRLALPTVSVQAGSLVLTGSHAGTVLVSSPGAPDPRARRVMTVFVAKGTVPGRSWTRYPVTLDDTPASYSDLVQVDDATVGVLYETGTTSWHEGIAYRSVPIAALTAGATVRSSATVILPKHARARADLHVGVQVTAAGTASPAGRIRVVVAKRGWRRTVTLPLLLPGNGYRVATVRAVPKGRYSVRVRYLGTPRIEPVTVTRPLRVR
jgi:sialidase-1